MTAHDTFEEAYNNPFEIRRLTQKGVKAYEADDLRDVDCQAEMKRLGAMT